MDPDQFQQLVKGINVQNKLLADIKSYTKTISNIMVWSIILGVVLGACTAIMSY